MEDWKATIHDCYYDVKGVAPDDKTILKINDSLPDNIKFLVAQWGWNDTEVGDKTFRYIKETF